MENFVLLGVCFLLGVVLRRGKIVDEKGVVALNGIIIHVSLPALALLYTHSLPVGPELLIPAAMAWILFGVGLLVFYGIGKVFGLDRKTITCLTLCAGLGNTSFVGLPMIEAFYGREFLGVGMLCDTAGTFMALAIPGIILAARASGHNIAGWHVAKKVLLFPPFFAVAFGFAMQSVEYPGWFESVLSRLGSTLTPLALLSVGMTLRFEDLRGNGRSLAIGLGYKLFAAPLLIGFLYMGILGNEDMITRVTVFEAAMGPMITGGIIAMTYGLNPRLASALLGVGIPMSFLTVPLWYFLLGLI
ncbi:AEC family transporter [Pseudodesulfovibrio piezophilus]|uniref:Auxin Efflux Carrier n=1 Tax=Pseudodesulfovibrio piezophilus (strain DSM 21447 / JCM 15486 / C1TLV30) TaxID=1322246 RepID=M1WKY8_PSEP2|nr:AEC family transporter [Pseudodesulfovibrio piezophilus]CCH50421.1 Auxin Efflux Carrier [Pseudodesulfovibrio piezophilus C1TLV30]